MISELNMIQPLSVISDQYLDRVPVFKIDTGIQQNSPNYARRQVLRRTFQPLVLFLIDQGHTTEAEIKSPESILNTVIGRPELQIDENLATEIREKYRERTPDEPARDWIAESLEISLAGDTHPIRRLSQVVTGKLSENARRELTSVGIGG